MNRVPGFSFRTLAFSVTLLAGIAFEASAQITFSGTTSFQFNGATREQALLRQEALVDQFWRPHGVRCWSVVRGCSVEWHGPDGGSCGA